MYPSLINDEVDELMELLKKKKFQTKTSSLNSESVAWSEFSGYNTTTG